MKLKVGDDVFFFTKKKEGKFQKTTEEDLLKLKEYMSGKQKITEPREIETKPTIEPVKEQDLTMPVIKETTKPKIEVDDILRVNLELLFKGITKIGYPFFEGEKRTIEQMERIIVNAEISQDFILKIKALECLHIFWKWHNDQLKMPMNNIMLHISKAKA
jgi:hypothetical protein